jgi:hypothetical protein
MELTGFPFWKLTYDDDFKIAGNLSEAQDFVRQHEVSLISFYVNVMCTEPGVGGRVVGIGGRVSISICHTRWLQRIGRIGVSIGAVMAPGVCNSCIKSASVEFLSISCRQEPEEPALRVVGTVTCHCTCI